MKYSLKRHILLGISDLIGIGILVFLSNLLIEILPYDISRTEIPWVVTMILSFLVIKGVHHNFFDYHEGKKWSPYFKKPFFARALLIIVALIISLGALYFLSFVLELLIIQAFGSALVGKEVNPILRFIMIYYEPISTFMNIAKIGFSVIIFLVIILGSDYYFMKCLEQNIKLSRYFLYESIRIGAFILIFGSFVALQMVFPLFKTAIVAIPIIVIGFLVLVYVELIIYQKMYKQPSCEDINKLVT